MIKTMEQIGYLGQDATVTVLDNGTRAINFAIAFNEEWADEKTGVVQKRVSWTDCVIYRKKDKSFEIAKYLKARTQVYVRGLPTPGCYQRKDDNTWKATLNLRVKEISLLSKNPNAQS